MALGRVGWALALCMLAIPVLCVKDLGQAAPIWPFPSTNSAACDSPIYCKGPLLYAVNSARLYNDSKMFVDMPMRFDPNYIINAFNKLGNYSKESLLNFVDQHFDASGSEVIGVLPDDFDPNPAFLDKISDPHLKTFGLGVHDIWLNLTAQFDHSKYCADCYSSIQVPNHFVMAGKRFHEYYYWDSYWTMHGLLVSGMTNTTKGMIQNFASLVSRFGFVPNGGRVYYLNRSQPPLLTQMVKIYLDATSDTDLLKEILPILDQEYAFWMKNRTVSVTLPTGTWQLNQYNVRNQVPRPEAFAEDLQTAKGLNASAMYELFGHISSAAETGWDFSSRWMHDYLDLQSLSTKDIVPVDLNSILYLNEVTLAQFHSNSNQTMASYYRTQAQSRVKAIMAVFWDANRYQWLDYDMALKAHNDNWYPSNLLPLWAGAHDGTITADLLQKMYNEIGIVFSFKGGVPTSFIANGQQWDYPNSWAPLQFFTILGMENMSKTWPLAKELAHNMTQAWVHTNYCGWTRTGYMFEKYDVNLVGYPGGGGEYAVQSGFGWTNGVALYLLDRYGAQLSAPSC